MSTPGAKVSERIPIEEIDVTETTKDMFSPSAHIVENEEEKERLEELREQVGTQNDGPEVMINDESRPPPESVQLHLNSSHVSESEFNGQKENNPKTPLMLKQGGGEAGDNDDIASKSGSIIDLKIQTGMASPMDVHAPVSVPNEDLIVEQAVEEGKEHDD